MKTSLTGLMAASKDLGVISNNLANASTTGYKRSTAQFQDLVPAEGAGRPGVEAGRGVMTVEIRRSALQGPLESTNGTLDLAVNGTGWLVLGSAKGGDNADTAQAFTRAGRLTMDETGRLVTSDGSPVLGYKALTGGVIGGDPQPIDILAAVGNKASNVASISVGVNGLITVTTPNGTNVPAGTIALAEFPNDSGLRSIGGNQLVPTVKSGEPRFAPAQRDGLGTIQQGTLEGSNVDITAEILNMVRAQQAYNGNARALQTSSEMLRTATETLIR